MPTTKQKPPQPAAEPKLAPAAAPTPEPSRREARLASIRRRHEALQELRSLLDISEHRLEFLDALALILSRDTGCTTPAESFITGILHAYIYAEDRGEGLTVEDVESKLETLRADLPDAIKQSYFIADRYPRPEASDAE